MLLELAGKKRRPLRVPSAPRRAKRVRAAIRVAIVEEREERVQNGLAGGRRAATDDRPLKDVKAGE